MKRTQVARNLPTHLGLFLDCALASGFPQLPLRDVRQVCGVRARALSSPASCLAPSGPLLASVPTVHSPFSSVSYFPALIA